MLPGLFLDPTENIKWITIVSSGCGITSTPVYIWMATLEILRRSEKCRQEFPLVPDAPCNSAIINPATRSSSLGTRTSAESHSFVGTGNWGHRVLCNTTSHSPSQNYYLFVTHKYCLHMKILLAVRDYCIFVFYLLEQIFFRNIFFSAGQQIECVSDSRDTAADHRGPDVPAHAALPPLQVPTI